MKRDGVFPSLSVQSNSSVRVCDMLHNVGRPSGVSKEHVQEKGASVGAKSDGIHGMKIYLGNPGTAVTYLSHITGISGCIP